MVVACVAFMLVLNTVIAATPQNEQQTASPRTVTPQTSVTPVTVPGPTSPQGLASPATTEATSISNAKPNSQTGPKKDARLCKSRYNREVSSCDDTFHALDAATQSKRSTCESNAQQRRDKCVAALEGKVCDFFETHRINTCDQQRETCEYTSKKGSASTCSFTFDKCSYDAKQRSNTCREKNESPQQVCNDQRRLLAKTCAKDFASNRDKEIDCLASAQRGFLLCMREHGVQPKPAIAASASIAADKPKSAPAAPGPVAASTSQSVVSKLGAGKAVVNLNSVTKKSKVSQSGNDDDDDADGDDGDGDDNDDNDDGDDNDDRDNNDDSDDNDDGDGDDNDGGDNDD
jgi:hypothetical protein